MQGGSGEIRERFGERAGTGTDEISRALLVAVHGGRPKSRLENDDVGGQKSAHDRGETYRVRARLLLYYFGGRMSVKMVLFQVHLRERTREREVPARYVARRQVFD